MKLLRAEEMADREQHSLLTQLARLQQQLAQSRWGLNACSHTLFPPSERARKLGQLLHGDVLQRMLVFRGVCVCASDCNGIRLNGNGCVVVG